MPGFPNRPTRAAFGPKPQNRRPVRNPAQEMDGPTVADLLMWQTAGMGVVSAAAFIYVPVAAAAITVAGVAHSECWNPNADQTPPTPTRTGLGVFTVQYAAAFPDKDGISQALNLLAALPVPQGLGATGHFMIAVPTRIDGRTFQIDLLRTDTMAHDDANFACWFI